MLVNKFFSKGPEFMMSGASNEDRTVTPKLTGIGEPVTFQLPYFSTKHLLVNYQQ